MIACTMLNEKSASAPILNPSDSDLSSVVVVYANKWVISAVMIHDYDGACYPVSFAGRTIKGNEIDYGEVGKEFLGLNRRLESWAAVSSNRSMEIQNCGREDDEALGEHYATKRS